MSSRRSIRTDRWSGRNPIARPRAHFHSILTFVAFRFRVDRQWWAFLPAGGLLTAIFVGWVMKREMADHEMQQDHPRLLTVWRWVLRYISPILVLMIIVNLFFPIANRFVAE